MRKTLIKLISTFFYIGYLPFIPGTFGSLAGVLVYCFLKNNTLSYILATFALVIIGIIFAGKAEAVFNKKDPRCVVIDEVAGILISFMFLPFDVRLLVVGFFVFRLLDTLKPYPACVFERRHGGVGIMGDDIVAGIYTNIILQVFFRLSSLIAW